VNLIRNSIYILFPATGIMSHKLIICSRLRSFTKNLFTHQPSTLWVL